MTASITDFSHFTGLRAAAEKNDPAVLHEVAGQFEALFIQTMLKTMRDASLGDPLFGNSDQHEMYEEMLDQQMALEMASGNGIGLAEMLVRQLGGASESDRSDQDNLRLPAIVNKFAEKIEPLWSDAKSFARAIWPHAERVAKQLNVAPEAIVAQAALETGWGAHVPQRSDGNSSFNLFGIKAGKGWSGDSAVRPTLEFEFGVAQPQQAKFRAYENIAATFDDYSELLSRNPRYASVANRGDDADGFADALQSSGYATDPSYADKLKRVMRSSTLQNALHGLKSLAPSPILSFPGR